MRKVVILILVVLFDLSFAISAATSQDDDRINPTPDPRSKYKVYVPKDLDDAFMELKKMLSSKTLKEMKEKKDEAGMIAYHFGLDLWMRNNWELWGGGRLAKYFNSLGVYHPDDMSGIILEAFWCHLNGKPLRLEERIERGKQYWQAMAKPKNRRCPKDNSVIALGSSQDVLNENGHTRIIYHGVCKKRGHKLNYEYDRGWYDPPTKKLVAEQL